MKKYAIVTDFDGTITHKDIGNTLAIHFGKTSEEKIEEAYDSKSDARDWMRHHFGSITAGEKEFTEVLLANGEIRDGFEDLLNYCLVNSVPIEIASGGLDIYIHPILKKYNLPAFTVRSASGVFTHKGIQVDFPDYEGESLEGFKKARVLKLKEQGYYVIFCGDGQADYDAAMASDMVYATERLARLFAQASVYYKDLDFREVLKQVKGGK